MSVALDAWWTRGRAWTALALVFALGFALRITGITSPMAPDEQFSYDEYIRPGLERALFVRYQCNNQPLNTITGWAMSQFWGDADIALRTPPLIAGMALILVVYAFGVRAFGGRGPAVFAAFMVATQLYHAAYSSNFRSYTMVTLFATLTAWQLAAHLKRPHWKYIIGISITVCLMAFSHIVSLILLAGWGIALLVYLAVHWQRTSWRSREVWLGFVGGCTGLAGGLALTSIAYWPAFNLPKGAAVRLLTGKWPFDAGAFVSGAEQKEWMAFDRYTDTVTGLMGWPFWVAAIIAVSGAFAYFRRGNIGAGVILASLLGPVVTLVTIGLKIEPRYSLSLLPFYCMCAGAGIWWAALRAPDYLVLVAPRLSRFRGVIAVTVVLALCGAWMAVVLQRHLADFPISTPNLATVLWDHNAPLKYIRRHGGPRDVAMGSPGADMSFDHCADKLWRRYQPAPDAPAKATRIWLVTSPNPHPEENLAYPTTYTLVEQYSYSQLYYADVQTPGYHVVPLGPVSDALAGGPAWCVSGITMTARPVADQQDPEHTLWFEGTGEWADVSLQSVNLPVDMGRLLAFRVWVYKGDAGGDVMAQLYFFDAGGTPLKFRVSHEPRIEAHGEPGWQLLCIETVSPPDYVSVVAEVRWRARLEKGQRVGIRDPELWLDMPRERIEQHVRAAGKEGALRY